VAEGGVCLLGSLELHLLRPHLQHWLRLHIRHIPHREPGERDTERERERERERETQRERERERERDRDSLSM